MRKSRPGLVGSRGSRSGRKTWKSQPSCAATGRRATELSPRSQSSVRWRLLLSGLGWLVLLGGGLSLSLLWGEGLWRLLSDEARLQEALTGFGPWGPIVFIGLQVFQIIIFVIPGELVQIAGGYIFGPWLGLVYSLIGIALGSAGAFFLGRVLGRPFVEALVRRERVEEFDRALRHGRGLALLFLLFLIPGVPKDILCYLSGLSAIPFLLFLIISLIARLPGLALSVVFGSKLAGREWGAALAIAAAALILLIFGRLLRARLRTLEEWLLRRLGGGGSGGE